MARNGSPRRRALADLPGNKDSPICGLIPSFSRIEISSQSILKSSKTAGISCANPAMAPAGFDPQPAEIAAGIESPIGENLLRSQVQILLNKVESEAPRDNNRSRFKDIAPDLCLNFHSHSISPALRLVAPTPMNTPLGGSSIPAPPPPPAAPSSSSSSLTPRSRSDSSPHGLQDALHGNVADMEDSKESRQDSGIELFVDLTISPQIMSASRESSGFKNDESEGGESERGSSLMKHTPIRIAESVTSGGNHHHHAVTPLTATHEDKARAFLGKSTTRTLRFDSPEEKTKKKKASCDEEEPFEEEEEEEEEEEDDRASEWSVLVNVSSPNGKEGGDNELDDDDDDDDDEGDNELDDEGDNCVMGRKLIMDLAT